MPRTTGSRNIPSEFWFQDVRPNEVLPWHRRRHLTIGIPSVSESESMSRRVYPRTHEERTGQVNWRSPAEQDRVTQSDKKTDPSRCSRFDRDPDHVIFTTQHKSPGSAAKDSQPMPPRTADMAKTVFPSKNFFRYQTNFYLKGQ